MVSRGAKLRVCPACGGRNTIQNAHSSCADCGSTWSGDVRDYDSTMELLIGEERSRQRFQSKLREDLFKQEVARKARKDREEYTRMLIRQGREVLRNAGVDVDDEEDM